MNQIFDFVRGMNPGLAQGGELRFSPLVIPHCFVTRQAAWNKFKIFHDYKKLCSVQLYATIIQLSVLKPMKFILIFLYLIFLIALISR